MNLFLQINLKNIDELVNKRINEEPTMNSNYLAAILKQRRLQKKWTLHDATDKICSEAYLSKLERNKMDNYKNDRTELLCERLDIDYYKLVNLESNNRVEVALYFFFDDDFESILNIEDKMCEDAFVAQDELIKAYKAYILKDFKAFSGCIALLDSVKECLSDIELFALILIMYKYYLLTLQYGNAFKYLHLLEKLEINNKKCELYLKEQKFILCCKNENTNVNYLYNELRYNFPFYSFYKQMIFNIFYNETLNTVEAYEFLESMKDINIPKVYTEEYKYAVALLLSKLGKYLEAMSYIKEIITKDVRFASLFAYNLCMYKKETSNVDEKLIKVLRQELIELIKNSDQSSADAYHIAFLRLMQYEIDNTKADIIYNYIKNQMFKELAEFSYPLYDNYIRDRYCELLGKLCRYKDAYLFLVDNKNNLKKKLI